MTILAYDKKGNHPGGRNALFYDSHVEFIPEEEFAARLQESLEWAKKQQWDKYTPERQKAIEAFYADPPPVPSEVEEPPQAAP